MGLLPPTTPSSVAPTGTRHPATTASTLLHNNRHPTPCNNRLNTATQQQAPDNLQQLPQHCYTTGIRHPATTASTTTGTRHPATTASTTSTQHPATTASAPDTLQQLLQQQAPCYNCLNNRHPTPCNNCLSKNRHPTHCNDWLLLRPTLLCGWREKQGGRLILGVLGETKHPKRQNSSVLPNFWRKVEWEAQTSMRQCSTSTFQNSCVHAGVEGNDRADRLARKATTTSGLRLGRSQMLRSLRHYLRAQSRGLHAIDRLVERGVERGSVQRSSLKRKDEKGHRQSHTGRIFCPLYDQANIGTVSMLGTFLRGNRRIWDFPSSYIPP